MILDEVKSKVRVGGDISETEAFSIKATGKAFRGLIDGLYSDKIGAIVREIVSNQWDAHQMAGKLSVPFKIQSPTFLSPYAVFEDYGVGISPRDMLTSYTVMFQSMKDESNDVLGAFGLGRLTPLSYTDQYTAISRYNGEENFYQVYLDAKGVPVINHIDCGPWEGSNGFVVKIPVEPKDVGEWEEKITSFIKLLNPMPINNLQIDNELTTLLSSDTWRIIEETNKGYGWRISTPVFIKQGIVAYPLERSKISQFIDYRGVDIIEIDVPIGSVDITMSRENLSYTDKTRTYLDSRLIEFKKEVAEVALESCQNAVTPFEKMEAFNIIAKYCKNTASLPPFSYKGTEWNWKTELKIYNNHISPEHFTKYGTDWKVFNVRYDQYTVPYKPKFRLHVMRHSISDMDSARKVGEKTGHSSIFPSYALFLVPDEHRWKAKIASNRETIGPSILVVIQPAKGVTLEEAVKEFTEVTGHVPTWSSKLPLPIEKAPKKIRDYGKTPLYAVGKSGWWDGINEATVRDLMASSGVKLYIESTRFKVELFGKKFQKNEIGELIKSLIQFGLIDKETEVYAVPKSNSNLLEDFDDKWVSLKELCEKNETKIRNKIFSMKKRLVITRNFDLIHSNLMKLANDNCCVLLKKQLKPSFKDIVGKTLAANYAACLKITGKDYKTKNEDLALFSLFDVDITLEERKIKTVLDRRIKKLKILKRVCEFLVDKSPIVMLTSELVAMKKNRYYHITDEQKVQEAKIQTILQHELQSIIDERERKHNV